jgi:hypothetical protein
MNGGVDGVELVFPGFEPGEEWVYAVTVVGGRGGAVHVRCRDTLFAQSYAGLPAPQLAGRIGADVLAHNESFVSWRSSGGQPSLGEQHAITPLPGIPCAPGFRELLERRYRMGQTLAAGPAEGWWVQTLSKGTLGGQIGLGSGADPTYNLRGKVPVSELPEYRELARHLRLLGTIGLGFGAVSAIAAGVSFTWAGYNVFLQRVDLVLMRALQENFWPLLSFLGASMFSLAWILAGLRLRALRNRTLILVCVGVGMLPCLGPCGFAGMFLGGWTMWKLLDERARAVVE